VSGEFVAALEDVLDL
jgi:DDE superfamily endonuclease